MPGSWIVHSSHDLFALLFLEILDLPAVRVKRERSFLVPELGSVHLLEWSAGTKEALHVVHVKTLGRSVILHDTAWSIGMVEEVDAERCGPCQP